MSDLQSDSIDRIIEMAWEDRTSFEAIEYQFGLSENEVIMLMRKEMKASSFRMMSLSFNTQSINRPSLSKRQDRTGLLTTHPELLDQHGDFISEELLVVRFPELGESEPTPA